MERLKEIILISVSEDDMRAFFDKFGELSFVQLKKKPDGSSRGYGFIRFVDMQDQVRIEENSNENSEEKAEQKGRRLCARGIHD